MTDRERWLADELHSACNTIADLRLRLATTEQRATDLDHRTRKAESGLRDFERARERSAEAWMTREPTDLENAASSFAEDVYDLIPAEMTELRARASAIANGETPSRRKAS